MVGDADEKDSPLRRWCCAIRFKIRLVLAKTSFNIIGEMLVYGGVRVAGPTVRRVRPARREGDAAREKETEKSTHREWSEWRCWGINSRADRPSLLFALHN